MTNEVITKFLDERKEAWLKKNLKSTMLDDEILELQEQGSSLFSLEVWLPKASKRAGQISMATHPCTFSHPSARKNKNGYVTSIIAMNTYEADGLLRSGNVKVQSDALGNAAALDVHKFLNLVMPDEKVLIEHIQEDTPLAKSLLNIKSKSYEMLKDEFLEMVKHSEEPLTSSKIKQVYFPVEDDYHLLSILSNSGMIYHLRKRLDAIRFGEDEEGKNHLKELRESRKNGTFSEDGFVEIYNLTTIGGSLRISRNHALSGLSGLERLTFVGNSLDIFDCNAIMSMMGLNNLNTIGGGLSINDNESLASLSG